MTELESHNGYYLWKYVPSLVAAVIFILLFFVSSIAHTWRMCKTRTWFCTIFTIGGFFEVIGYISRATAHDQTGKLMPFVIQNFFILLAPALFAASIYTVLGRIIHAVRGENLSVIPVRWLTRAFVAGDLLSFAIQGGAAGLMVTGKNVDLGSKIVVIGLVLQVILFGLFILTAVVFQVRILNFPTLQSYNNPDISWKQNLNGLYAMSGLAITRSIFRVVEYSMGNDGYPLSNEWTLYIFDSLPMFFVMVILYFYYPSKISSPTKDAETGNTNLVSISFPREGAK